MIPLPRPATITGSFILGDAAIERYRVLAVVVGLVVFAAMWLLLNRTRIGLLDPRRRREPARWSSRSATASGGSSSACSSPARRLAGLGGVMWAHVPGVGHARRWACR